MLKARRMAYNRTIYQASKGLKGVFGQCSRTIPSRRMLNLETGTIVVTWPLGTTALAPRGACKLAYGLSMASGQSGGVIQKFTQMKEVPDTFSLPSLSAVYLKTGDCIIIPMGFLVLEKALNEVTITLKAHTYSTLMLSIVPCKR